MRVLIAEDDLVSRKVLRKTLERWGHDVLAAPDGDQAWAAFQHEAFPVVISDWVVTRVPANMTGLWSRRH
jgi:CheY-like chemotaxis protein